MRLGISLWPQGATWRELREASLRADALGYDSIWLYDHFTALGPDPSLPVFEGWTALAALASVTGKARLGTLVSGVTYRNPAVLAKMAATLDHISNGRAVLGLGAGWHEEEHRAYGIAFPSTRERLDLLEEACTLIRSLFAEEVTDFDGERCAVHDAVLWPKPIQRRLPILIGGGGERRTLRIVARHADLWNAFGTPDTVAHKAAVLREHCLEVGRDPSEIAITVNVGVIVRDDVAGVEARLMEIGPIAQFSDFSASNQPYGPPETVAQRLVEYLKAGVSEVIAVIPAPYDRETIERLATEVRPRVDSLMSGA
jgi:F420-dependent oxidoreductase-like protein